MTRRVVDGCHVLRTSNATSVSLEDVFVVGVGATVGEEDSLKCDDSYDKRDIDVCGVHPDRDDV